GEEGRERADAPAKEPGEGRGRDPKGALGPEPEAEGRPGGSLPAPALGDERPRPDDPERPRPAGPPPPARPPGASRYGWLVGVLVVVILTYILINTLR